MMEWQQRPQKLVASYIKKELHLSKARTPSFGRLPTLTTLESYEDTRARYDSTSQP